MKSPRADPTHTLLMVDDERPFCVAVASQLAGTNLEVLTAHDAKSGLAICNDRKVDVVLLDQMLPDGLGSELCEPILKLNERTKIVLITAHPSFDHAVGAIKKGAFDYLTKPIDLREIELVVQRALRTIELEKTEMVARYQASKQAAAVKLVGSSERLDQVHELIERAAASDAAVLITGETGTGKNVAAKALHFGSARAEGPFIHLNCAALPENLIEAELFGHTKGAFTGASAERRGVFEMADGGTLLLDEIGSMSIDLQPKLLNVLEEGLVRRIGSDTARRVDVRVLGATNAALDEAIEQRTFRQDLYYRLNVIRLDLPPLRERLDDLPELCAHFLTELSPAKQLQLAEGEIEQLANYDWPGNVRELRNVLERATALQRGPRLAPSKLVGQRAAKPPKESSKILTLEEVERRHITKVLAQLGGNLSQTATATGISVNTLKRKLQRYGLR